MLILDYGGNGPSLRGELTPIRLFHDHRYPPTSLRVENYAHGSDAALDSWVVLVRKEGGASGAE